MQTPFHAIVASSSLQQLLWNPIYPHSILHTQETLILHTRELRNLLLQLYPLLSRSESQVMKKIVHHSICCFIIPNRYIHSVMTTSTYTRTAVNTGLWLCKWLCYHCIKTELKSLETLDEILKTRAIDSNSIRQLIAMDKGHASRGIMASSSLIWILRRISQRERRPRSGVARVILPQQEHPSLSVVQSPNQQCPPNSKRDKRCLNWVSQHFTNFELLAGPCWLHFSTKRWYGNQFSRKMFQDTSYLLSFESALPPQEFSPQLSPPF